MTSELLQSTSRSPTHTFLSAPLQRTAISTKEASLTIPIEVRCSVSAVDQAPLRQLLSTYISHHLYLLFGPSSERHHTDPLSRPSSRCPANRMSLLIPIFSSAPLPIQRGVFSIRLGDYGPLEDLEMCCEKAFLRSPAPEIDHLQRERRRHEREDETLFSSLAPPAVGCAGTPPPESLCLGLSSTEGSKPAKSLNSPSRRVSELPPARHTAETISPNTSRGVQGSSIFCLDDGKPCQLKYNIVFFEVEHNTSMTLIEGTSSSTLDDSATLSSPCIGMLPLPHVSLEGLWESLVYGDSLHASRAFKRHLLGYMHTNLLFSVAGVDPLYVAWNRMLLFYGPPGTGKTSLCKALAQKLSIVLKDRFPRAVMVEIHPQHIFSRFFSESGKQVTEIFKRLKEVASDPECLVAVVLDEVEALVVARQTAMKGNEPTDALRVVNAILTQLDELQNYPNILVFATSNLMDAMDDAFLDRADKKLYIGPPGWSGRRIIIQSSLSALLEKKLVRFSCPVAVVSTLLHEIATASEGFSGRYMRKASGLAFSNTVESTGLFLCATPTGHKFPEKGYTVSDVLGACETVSVDILLFLNALLSLVRSEAKDQLAFQTLKRNKRERSQG